MKYIYGKNVLITGASSGIGMACAELLCDRGYHVFGLSRRGGEDKSSAEGGFIHHICADVTDDSSVKAAVAEAIAMADTIDILINAAGNGLCGAVDECTAEDALAQMNTNYLGVVRMINEIVPLMRERRNGIVVNIGSVGGIFAIPFQSLYSSSKFAVEALTECMRIELLPFNVRACLVEPGDIKTGFTSARKYTEKAKRSAYGEPFRRAIAQMEKDERGGAEPISVAKAVLYMINRKNPPIRKVAGAFIYKVFPFLKRILPSRLVERVLTAMYPNSRN